MDIGLVRCKLLPQLVVTLTQCDSGLKPVRPFLVEDPIYVHEGTRRRNVMDIQIPMVDQLTPIVNPFPQFLG